VPDALGVVFVSWYRKFEAFLVGVPKKTNTPLSSGLSPQDSAANPLNPRHLQGPIIGLWKTGAPAHGGGRAPPRQAIQAQS
jgi:hypothetical protein